MKVFCSYDSKVEKYLQPFFMRTTKEAVRAIETVCSDPSTQFNKFPADFAFFELGDFDDDTAKFNLLNAPHSLGLAQDFMRSRPASIQEVSEK